MHVVNVRDERLLAAALPSSCSCRCKNLHTGGDVLRSRVAVGAHDLGHEVRLPSGGPVDGEPEVRQLRGEILKTLHVCGLVSGHEPRPKDTYACMLAFAEVS